ncbi:MAG: phenylalanine--tRNA ligase subunit beta [Planctomycetota bacterium]|nr:phenylalanine--tRNA ligase subunit beta [Planctomycetota bacterium]
MLVSWNWLKQYVPLDMTQAELEHRLSMSGLNHEGTRGVDDDLAIDLEVTSNRPDCLGHIGVAREIAVLWEQPLTIPDPGPASSAPAAAEQASVRLECPELCPRYTARVIRDVRIGPSPDWLVERLATVFRPLNPDWVPVNNVVDITNFVLMESGQPLHAFDLEKIAGGQVVVRQAGKDEPFTAIDHHEYSLQPGMCVIADTEKAIALGGVMGGADSEVSSATTCLLIESARFDPLATRNTARALNLYSPSSHRFERGVDPVGVEWASRRCCELILEIGGGELAEGIIDIGEPVAEPKPVILRLSQLKRILGIDVDPDEVNRILTALGNSTAAAGDGELAVTAPSWRRDLTREIDLVEEVARIHGYEKIPEDVGVPMAPSHRTDRDRVESIVRQTLLAASLDEAMTASMVPASWPESFTGWTEHPPISSQTPMLKGADRLRTSLLPSLLEARRVNESLANPVIELFETASIYLARDGELPVQQWTLAITSAGGYYRLKGIVEGLLAALKIDIPLEVKGVDLPLLDLSRSGELCLDERRLGFLGAVSPEGLKQFSLRHGTSLVELNLDLLAELAELVPQHQDQSAYPSISRDLNIVLAESVRWSQLEQLVRATAGKELEQVDYQETYRDSEKDGVDTKRILFSMTLRSQDGTMTGEQADQLREKVVLQIEKQLSGRLLS